MENIRLWAVNGMAVGFSLVNINMILDASAIRVINLTTEMKNFV